MSCYSHKIDSYAIYYDEIKKEITLQDRYDYVILTQDSFEEIIKIWRKFDYKGLAASFDGKQPGYRLYNEGIAISRYMSNNIRDEIWISENVFEKLVQAYQGFTKQFPQSVFTPRGEILINGNFLWENSFQLSCPRSIMNMLYSAPRDFTKLIVDDWTFEQRNEIVEGCYNQKASFQCPADEFFATINYWHGRNQE